MTLKYVIYILLLFLVYPMISCKSGKEQGNVDNTLNKTQTEVTNHTTSNTAIPNELKQKDSSFVYSDTTYIINVNKNIPKLKIERWYKITDEIGERIKLKIYDNKTNKQKQSIVLPEDIITVNNIEFDDYNFDGYIDFYVSYGMLSGNEFGYVYLYNKQRDRFMLAKEYNKLTSIRLRKAKKEIVSVNRSGAGAYWDEKVYKYRKGKLLLMQYRSQDVVEQGEDSCLYHYVYRKRDSNGKMRTIKNVKTSSPRFE